MRASLLDLGLCGPGPSCAALVPRVLVCGDADFAYALSLTAQLGSRACITATAYEAEDELLARYPHAAGAMAKLRDMGAFVRCGVDATALGALFGAEPAFERIVFNLPQAPPAPKARNQIQRHRALLRDFCGSAASVLAPHGELWVTLLAGQGGTPLDPTQRAPGDTWAVAHQAASAGLLVARVSEANIEALAAAGYTPTGRRSGEKAVALGRNRQQKGLVVHVCVAEEAEEEAEEAAEAAEAEARGGPARLSVAPLEWSLDNSFWLDATDEPSEEALFQTCRAALGPRAAHALPSPPRLVDSYERPCTFPVPSLYLPCTFPVPSQVDSYERPADGRRARTYRFAYRSDRLALSRERAKQMNELVVTALEREYYEPRGVSPAAAAAVEAAAAASGEAEEAAALQDGSGTEGARESKKLRSLRASGRSEACGSRDAHALP